MKQPSHPEVLLVNVNDALRMISLGRTKFYELIATGQVETVSVGGRRLVKVSSLRRLAGEDAAA